MKTLFSIIGVIAILLVCMLGADQGNYSIAVNGDNIMDSVSLAIFIFIVYFFVTIKSWSSSAKKEIITAIVVYCCFNVYMVSTNFGIMCIKRSRSSARTKACWSNIRVIHGAVEMYNMDVASMATSLDIPTLVKAKYLKTEPKGPENDCYYDSCGDLTQDGFIYCNHHLVPDTDEETIEEFARNNYSSSNYYSSSKNIPQELINKIKQNKNNTFAKKSFADKARSYWKNNWPTFKVLLLPVLVLFFPFTLHPLRN